jgi:DNA-binding Lrp family transcriptional regulator
MGKHSGVNKIKLTSLLLEYLRDSSRTDRQMAKMLGVSQPTVSRMRNRLLQEGLVRHFSAIPDFAKLGYEIMVFSFVKFNTEQVAKFDIESVMKIKGRAEEWSQSHPCIIFDARAEGMGVDAINISLHKDYAAYQKFLTDSKKEWGNLRTEVHYVLVDLVGGVAKPLSFKYLAEKNEK